MGCQHWPGFVQWRNNYFNVCILFFWFCNKHQNECNRFLYKHRSGSYFDKIIWLNMCSICSVVFTCVVIYRVSKSSTSRFVYSDLFLAKSVLDRKFPSTGACQPDPVLLSVVVGVILSRKQAICASVSMITAVINGRPEPSQPPRLMIGSGLLLATAMVCGQLHAFP